MTFKEYLGIPQRWDSVSAEFVKDVLGDPKSPDFATWGDLKRFLIRRNQSHAIEAARFVWDAYQAALDDELLV